VSLNKACKRKPANGFFDEMSLLEAYLMNVELLMSTLILLASVGGFH
jgi:hypothetical protein